jgi:predicted membrane chloride channel (bestrophin family)
LFLSNSLARWWTLREKSIGSIFSCLTDVAMLMVAHRPEPEWKPLHTQLTKFGLASIQLILKAARDNNDLTDLLAEELLMQDEVEYLEQLTAFHRPVAVWSWILRLCQFAWIDLPPPIFNPIQVLCTQAKSSIDNIYTYQRTQMPFAYTHLVACLTHAQNVFVAIQAGLRISLDIASTEAWVREIAMAVIACLIYQGLLALTYIIEDPFGDDLLDFPVKSYTAYVMASVNAVQKAQWHSPALQKLKAQLQASGS